MSAERRSLRKSFLSARRTLITTAFMSISAQVFAHECVVLLHGLARTSSSMEPLAEQLKAEHYHVVNVDYPSREHSITELASRVIPEGVSACRKFDVDSNSAIDKKEPLQISFVTHSLGGILVRYYLKDNSIEELKRVVMLGPPNQGSQVVDELGGVPGFKAFNGPAGVQLGTVIESIPKNIGAISAETGIIAGTRSINLLLSNYLPNPDDGKVSVENARLEGMCSFLTVPVSHPYLMKNAKVIEQVILFLKTGEFSGETAENNLCKKLPGDF